MIYQPISVYPLNVAVDGSKTVDFSFEFSGDKLYAYQVIVYENNSTTSVYTGTKQTVSDIYNGDTVTFQATGKISNGKNLVWNVTLWEQNPTIFIVSGKFQSGSSGTSLKIRQHPSLKANMFIKYKDVLKKITAYDYDTGTATIESAFTSTPASGDLYEIYSDFIISPNYFFKSRTTPTVSIGSFTSPITSRQYTFSATYAQQENIAIKHHTWNLYDDTDSLVDTSGQVFSSNLKYSFDGFVGGKTYSIECIVETQDGVIVTTNKTQFSVSYAAPDISVPPKIEIDYNKNAAIVTWVKDRQSIGTATGDYSFVEDFPQQGKTSVNILDGEIYYDTVSDSPLSVDESNYTVLLSTVLNDSKDGKIIGIHTTDGIEYGVSFEKYGLWFFYGNETNKIMDFFYELRSGQTISGVPENNIGYIWDDTDVWDNTKYWTETITLISNKRLLIGMTPLDTTPYHTATVEILEEVV